MNLFLIMLILPVFIYAKSIELTKGWNLIGTPDDINLSSLNLSDKESIWTYKDNKWYLRSTIDQSIFPKLELIEAGSGFWFYSNSDRNISLPDTNKTAKRLVKGWNLVSPIQDLNLTKSADENVTSVWVYHDGWKLWQKGGVKNKIFDSFEILKRYEGAWYYVTSPSNIKIANKILIISNGNFGTIKTNISTNSYDLNFINPPKNVEIKIAIKLHRNTNNTNYHFAIGPIKIDSNDSLDISSAHVCAAKEGNEECKRIDNDSLIDYKNKSLTLFTENIANEFDKTIPKTAETMDIEIFTTGFNIKGSLIKSFETLTPSGMSGIKLDNATYIYGKLILEQE